MPKCRVFLTLSVTAFCLLLIGAFAWAQESGGTTAQGQGSGSGQSNFSMSGGAGSGGVNGQDGTSPYVKLSDVGLTSSVLYQVRAAYVIPASTFKFRITGEYLWQNLTSSDTTYNGLSHSFLFSGQAVQANLGMYWTTVGLDCLLPGYPMFQIGPRFEFQNYQDQFTLENTFTGTSDSRGRSYSMLGFGITGHVDLSYLVKITAGDMAYIKPVIGFTGTIGGSTGTAGMRYDNAEIWLALFRTAQYGYLPAVDIKFGWMFKHYKQTLDEITVANQNFSLQRPASVDAYISAPMVNGGIVF